MTLVRNRNTDKASVVMRKTKIYDQFRGRTKSCKVFGIIECALSLCCVFSSRVRVTVKLWLRDTHSGTSLM